MSNERGIAVHATVTRRTGGQERSDSGMDSQGQDFAGAQVTERVPLSTLTTLRVGPVARRVITSMPRRGVRELLPEMRTQDILYKAHLKYGADGLFLEFLDELVQETRSRRMMKRLIGPSNALWADVSREKGASGGGFRSFYYRIKREHPETFKEMWADIEKVADHVVCTPNEPLEIETTFGNRVAAKTRMKSIDPERNIGFLKLLLTHRMILLLRYEDGSEVVFTDADEPSRSYRHLPYWANGKKPVVKAEDYCAFTGFEASNYRPRPTGRSRL